MTTNFVSDIRFQYTGNSEKAAGPNSAEDNGQSTETISFDEEEAKKAKEKKAKAKALVEQKLSETPIRFGMADPVKAATEGTVASFLTGQTGTKTIDKYSVEQICADIDGYEEVKEDSGLKVLFSNFMNKFNGNSSTNTPTATVNSTESASLAASSGSGLMDVPAEVKLTNTDIKLLNGAGISTEALTGLSQASTTDKSQTEQLQTKTAAFSRMQEIQKKMADPNVSADDKAKLMTEAQELFASTPKATNTLPAGIANTSSSLAENMTTDEINSAMSFVKVHANGFDSTSPEFTSLPKNIQDYITAVDKDAKQNYKNGVKPADYKLSGDITPTDGV